MQRRASPSCCSSPACSATRATDPAALQAEALALLDAVLADFVAAREREGAKPRRGDPRARRRHRAHRRAKCARWCRTSAPALRSKLEARLADLAQPRRSGPLRAGTGARPAEARRRRGTRPPRQPRRRGRAACWRRRKPVGRRLDFLLQEFNREANTLGSKSVDARTSQRGGRAQGADRPDPRTDPEHRMTRPADARNPLHRRGALRRRQIQHRQRVPGARRRTSACRSRSPRARRARASGTPSTTTSSAPTSSRRMVASRRLLRARAGARRLEGHGASSRSSRSWPPARTCCWRSTGRARARCASRCPTRSASSSCRPRARRWKQRMRNARPGQRGGDPAPPGRRARGDVALRRVRLRDRQRGLRRPPSTRCARSSSPAACAGRQAGAPRGR